MTTDNTTTETANAPKTSIPETAVRLIAALAQAHPQTARRYLEGKPIRGHALRERLADAVLRADHRFGATARTAPKADE